jgi:hypothetical protein
MIAAGSARTARGREAALVAAALAAYVAVAVAAAGTHSATFDETAYLPAGYAALAAGDYRVNTQHPPLSKMLGALPLLFMDVRLDRADGAFVEAHAWKLGQRFLYLWNDADRLLARGRAAMTLAPVLMAAVMFLWVRHHWGRAAAGAALFLGLLSPDVLAHGALVTTDMAVAAFFFLAVAGFERVADRATAARIVSAGAALGAALLSKHSALLLVGVLPALVVAACVARDRASAALPRALGTVVLAGMVAYAALWAGYRFRYEAAGDLAPTAPLEWRTSSEPRLAERVAHYAADHRLLPEAYVHGVADLSVRAQGRRAFLGGALSSTGFWYYFPVAFLLKTPLPLLLLLGAAVVRRPDRTEAVFVWAPAVVFGAFALTTRVNIGYRYLLPVLPFAFVAAGVTVARLLERGRRMRIAVAALGAWYALGTLANHPHHLAYFNELAGGPGGGYRYLVDSNVDWGQDLKRLAAYVAAEHIPHVRLSYFGTASPDYYRVPHDLLPSTMRPFPAQFLAHVRSGDIVVVSATNLQGVYLPKPVRNLMERYRDAAPIARVGRSLFLYRSTAHWLLKPHLAEDLGWLPQAIASYRQCAAQDPEHRALAEEYLSDALERQARETHPPPTETENEEPALDVGDEKAAE